LVFAAAMVTGQGSHDDERRKKYEARPADTHRLSSLWLVHEKLLVRMPLRSHNRSDRLWVVGGINLQGCCLL